MSYPQQGGSGSSRAPRAEPAAQHEELVVLELKGDLFSNLCELCPILVTAAPSTGCHVHSRPVDRADVPVRLRGHVHSLHTPDREGAGQEPLPLDY
eukprot:1155914-Pelagomonas_calceolata.AAC.2